MVFRVPLSARALLLTGAVAGFRTLPHAISRSAAPLAAAAPLLVQPQHVRALRSSPPRAAADPAELESSIKETIAGSKVVVYSKSWCPFCQQTKATLDKLGIEATYIELDECDDGDQIQATLLGMTQQRTVPNVFVSGQHLGGNDDTQKAAASGKLQELLGM